ncbi:MAG: membrane dipeptidase [Tannerellaceae bacterium]|nr:membrane dipeptidase [Tannerellaceae bacterium]
MITDKLFIVDAHLDLSMNAMEWNRDLRIPIEDLNRREASLTDKPDRGHATVSFGELHKGRIGLVVATQIARYAGPGSSLQGWMSPEQAWAQTQGQLAWYRTMEEAGLMRMIKNGDELDAHLDLWMGNNPSDNKPIGFLLSLEGADSLVSLDYLERAYEYGLRAVGPAHYGPGRYANGTDSSGRLNADGQALLKKMEELNMILDVSHLNDDAFWHALELYHGPLWASHSNCRALVDHNRQLSDDMILALIERDAVIGVALDAWMLTPGWQRGVSLPRATNCSLRAVADNIDHICQLAGNSQCVAIGSDLDGAFGTEQCPYEVRKISDIHKLFDILRKRGYERDDIEAVANGNMIAFLRLSM